MQDLAGSDEAELTNALRLLLYEWCVRYGTVRSDLDEQLGELLSPNDGPWPVELRQDEQSHEIQPYLTEVGFAYALMSGRLERNYEAATALEGELLNRAGYAVRSRRRRE